MQDPRDEKHLPAKDYGDLNPVPKVAYLFENIVDPSAATKRKAKKASGEKAAQKEESLETRKLVKDMRRGKEREVHDPITKGIVTIKNADDDFDEMADPKRTMAENVLNHEFPPADWNAFATLAISSARSTLLSLLAVFAVSTLTAVTVPPPSRFTLLTSLVRFLVALLPTLLAAYVLDYHQGAVLKRDVVDRKWASERSRGEGAKEEAMHAGAEEKEGEREMGKGGEVEGQKGETSEEKEGQRVRESAEWANEIVKALIPIANPDVFSYLIDMLEDVMQASVPGFVHSVRISDLGLGTTPLRIIAIRSVPDAPEAHEHETEDEKGTHINLEIEFAYRASPSGGSIQSKAHNAHMMVEFFFGLKGVAGAAMPVWVEFRGAVGTARARLQLDSNPPFVKNCTVTLLGLPQIDIAASPMSQRLPNVMNLPLISTFIENSINTAAAEYVAPKHLVLNLKQLLAGDDIKKDTMAVGVVIIHIHRAVNIKPSDNNGKSDPYVVVCFSRLSKPLYSTRIIQEELNPVFEETAYIPIDVSLVKLHEKMQLQLWDSDRMSADDVLGQVEIDITELLRNEGKAVRRLEDLEGTDKGDRMPGQLEFTAGFYGKLPPTASKTDGSDPGIPQDLKDEPEFREARAIALDDLEASVLVTPPDPAYPSGILSIQIHEVTDLGINKSKGSMQGRKKGGQLEHEPDVTVEESGEHLPSSYCNILINDRRVYQTRVKPISGLANFNAGTEKFISDWRTSHVTVVVRDSRNRENDPIIGLAFFKLCDIFVNASEVTRIYPLERGIGYGRVRVSLLFRPIDATLSPNLLGFDIGTVYLRSVTLMDVDPEYSELSSCKLRIGTPTSEAKISSGDAQDQDDASVEWEPDQPLHLPLERRYSSAIVMQFRPTGVNWNPALPKAAAALWLRDLIDNEEKPVRVGVWRTKNYGHLEQNYISCDGHETECQLTDGDEKTEPTRIGTLELDIVFRPGLTEEHSKVRHSGDPRTREEQETLERMESGGLRDNIGATDSVTSVASGPDNTEVDVDHTEHVGRQNGHRDGDEGEDSDGASNKSIVEKFKDWRSSQHKLHARHRGVMQEKPVRTVKWIKDGIKKQGHQLTERFSLREREPDVDTEV